VLDRLADLESKFDAMPTVPTVFDREAIRDVVIESILDQIAKDCPHIFTWEKIGRTYLFAVDFFDQTLDSNDRTDSLSIMLDSLKEHGFKLKYLNDTNMSKGFDGHLEYVEDSKIA
jgi:hypothetical protein